MSRLFTTPKRSPYKGVPRARSLADAVAYAERREGLKSLVALVSSRGGLVATYQNFGTVGSPAVYLVGDVDLAEASYGGVLPTTDVGSAVSAWVEGSGLQVSGCTALGDYTRVEVRDRAERPVKAFHHEVSALPTLPSGQYVLGGVLAPTGGKYIMGGETHDGIQYVVKGQTEGASLDDTTGIASRTTTSMCVSGVPSGATTMNFTADSGDTVGTSKTFVSVGFVQIHSEMLDRVLASTPAAIYTRLF